MLEFSFNMAPCQAVSAYDKTLVYRHTSYDRYTAPDPDDLPYSAKLGYRKSARAMSSHRPEMRQ